MPEAAYRHADTFLTLRETASERRFTTPYQKTFDFAGDYLNDEHHRLVQKLHPSGMIDIGIEGWLLPPDALKLYEMAYCCPGDLLELGAFRGLSASVMNAACNSAGAGADKMIVSIDLDKTAVEKSRKRLHAMPGGKRAHFYHDEAAAALRNMAGIKRSFGFAFVDHSHRYEHVLSACEILHRVVALGGFALFHDFNDPRNSLPNVTEYGVYQGAMDGLRADRWEFWGLYGCTGLFRRTGCW